MSLSKIPFLFNHDKVENLNTVEKKKYLQKVKLLKHLYIKGAKSNAEICSYFDLSSPTSMKLINELIKEGLVCKKGSGLSVGGRKPELYGLQDHSFFVLSIHLDRNKARMAIFDNSNNHITEIKSIPFDISQKDITGWLVDHANDLISSSGIPVETILGIGISMPGLVDSKEGRNFTYFKNESSVSIRQELEEKFKRPVFILNDVKSGCLAEFRFGRAQAKRDILVLSIDGGIGLGIIMNGKIQTGSSGFAGEFGHIPFVEDGMLCHCGKRGCLETVASGDALARIVKEGLESGARSMLTNVTAGSHEVEPRMIIDAVHNGDQFATTILSQVGMNLGKGIAILIQIFNPELIILQGEIAEAKQFITTPIQHSINTYCMPQLRERTSIVLSHLGQNASILGSVAAVMENIFNRQIERAKSV